MDTKQEIFEEKLGEYLVASKEEKGKIWGTGHYAKKSVAQVTDFGNT